MAFRFWKSTLCDEINVAHGSRPTKRSTRKEGKEVEVTKWSDMWLTACIPQHVEANGRNDISFVGCWEM
jgi:hypothetical protein